MNKHRCEENCLICSNQQMLQEMLDIEPAVWLEEMDDTIIEELAVDCIRRLVRLNYEQHQ